VTDDIRALTTRLADEPGSLAFLELAETLRRRGQLDAALKIARGGLGRYPGLADAHDLLARILCDRGELPAAFEAWADTLRVDPLHPAALKGIAFLYFRAGEFSSARDYLERALDADPDDLAIPSALARIAAMADMSRAPVAPDGGAVDGATYETAPKPVESAELVASPVSAQSANPVQRGVLLVDGSGMRLRGTLTDTAARDVSDAVAAQLAGVSKEAARTTRLLELGMWENIAVESPDGHLVLVAPTAETVLLASASVEVPMARLNLLAEREARDARAWLEQER